MKIGFFFGTIVFVDQLTKLIVRRTMILGQSISVLGQFLKITYIENPGIAFGIRVRNNFLFTILSLLVSVGIGVYLFTHREEEMVVKGSLAIILGGAFGNLIDRVLYRQVADFIDVGIGNLRWPVFNVADSAVVIGMSILFLFTFLGEKIKLKNK